jgi:PAS domain S-box-containing protein
VFTSPKNGDSKKNETSAIEAIAQFKPVIFSLAKQGCAMSLFAALIYWLIVGLWTTVLVTVGVAYIRNQRTFGTTRLLLIVVAVDTVRNIVENIYFGLFFGSQYGLFASSIAANLANPYLLIIPKVINVIAAGFVIGLLIMRWLPLAADERSAAERETQEKSSALVEEIQKQQILFKESLDLILVTDQQGNLLRISQSVCDALGYSEENILGRNASEFILPEDLEATRQQMRNLRCGEPMRNFESKYLHKEGRAITIFWSGIWIAQAQRYFFIGRDMTEKQKLELELRQAHKMEAIGQLTGGIAHDYNNLLTVILGNTELLLEKLQGQPDAKALAEFTLEAAERSAVLTQRLLAFGRRQSLEPVLTDVNELLEGMRDLLRMTLGVNVSKEFKFNSELWQTKVDRNQLETVIVNLCVNARDAMQSSGILTIETDNKILDDDYTLLRPDVTAGEYIEIAVSDTGAGMTREVLERAFEPFFTTKEVGKGTGLGLSMIYGFVKQSGGHISIYSEIDIGTVIRIYLPRANEISIVPTLENVTEAPIQMGDELVLLVEDDDLVRNHTQKQLLSLGYEVRSAANGVDALAQLAAGLKPDLILTDIIMAGNMSGWQLADQIDSEYPGTRIVFMSGYTAGSVALEASKREGIHFLNKPFRRLELAAKIRDALESDRLVRAV